MSKSIIEQAQVEDGIVAKTERKDRSLLRDKRGSEMAEKCVIAGLVVVACIAAFTQFGDAVKNGIQSSASAIGAAGGGGGGGGGR